VNLAYWENGFRNMTNSRRPVGKAEDFDGIKLRVMQSTLFIDTFKTLVANPTPMAFGEVFTALQTQPIFPSLFRSLPATLSAPATTASAALSATWPAPATALAPAVLALSSVVWAPSLKAALVDSVESAALLAINLALSAAWLAPCAIAAPVSCIAWPALLAASPTACAAVPVASLVLSSALWAACLALSMRLMFALQEVRTQGRAGRSVPPNRCRTWEGAVTDAVSSDGSSSTRHPEQYPTLGVEPQSCPAGRPRCRVQRLLTCTTAVLDFASTLEGQPVRRVHRRASIDACCGCDSVPQCDAMRLLFATCSTGALSN
jgi:hypothetical protein